MTRPVLLFLMLIRFWCFRSQWYLLCSSSVKTAEGVCSHSRAAKASPAGPAPMMRTSCRVGSDDMVGGRMRDCGGVAVCFRCGVVWSKASCLLLRGVSGTNLSALGGAPERYPTGHRASARFENADITSAGPQVSPGQCLRLSGASTAWWCMGRG